MKELNEDYTAGVLAGIPIFCINRIYKSDIEKHYIFKIQYRFRFENNYGASVIEFRDHNLSNGSQYELAVLKFENNDGTITYDTSVTTDIERGNDMDIHKLLIQIEEL